VCVSVSFVLNQERSAGILKLTIFFYDHTVIISYLLYCTVQQQVVPCTTVHTRVLSVHTTTLLKKKRFVVVVVVVVVVTHCRTHDTIHILYYTLRALRSDNLLAPTSISDGYHAERKVNCFGSD